MFFFDNKSIHFYSSIKNDIIMKFFYIAALVLLLYNTTNATTWNVSVANFSFNPATINAVIGDVIQFNWVTGTHTTTCGSNLAGTSLPAGAAEWDKPITSGATSYSYTVTVAGNYLYGCRPHFGFGMQGSIIVSGALPVAFGSFSVTSAADKGLLQWQTFPMTTKDELSSQADSTGLAPHHTFPIHTPSDPGTRRA